VGVDPKRPKLGIVSLTWALMVELPGIEPAGEMLHLTHGQRDLVVHPAPDAPHVRNGGKSDPWSPSKR
jgi:hypothetical protein